MLYTKRKNTQIADLITYSESNLASQYTHATTASQNRTNMTQRTQTFR
jgi:hypothetical protein